MTDQELIDLEHKVDDLLSNSGASNSECVGILDMLVNTFRDRANEEDEG